MKLHVFRLAALAVAPGAEAFALLLVFVHLCLVTAAMLALKLARRVTQWLPWI